MLLIDIWNSCSGFQRIQLKPGESRAVEFKITPKELGYYNDKGEWLMEPGQFEVWMAAISRACSRPEVTRCGWRRSIRSSPRASAPDQTSVQPSTLPTPLS